MRSHDFRDEGCIDSSRIRGVSAADPRNPKQLCEGKTGDQRAAAHTGCKKDDFFGNDLHGNSCRSGDEGGGASSR